MKISVVSGAPDARTADLVVYAAFAAPSKKPAPGLAGKRAKKAAKTAAKKTEKAAPPWAYGGHLADVDDALGGLLLDTARKEGFKGSPGSTFSFHTHGRIAAGRVVLIGLGAAERISMDSFRKLGGLAAKAAERTKSKRIVIVLPDGGELRMQARVQAAAEGVRLAHYRFDKYLTKDKEPRSLDEVELSIHGGGKKVTEEALERARAISEGVALARDLVNEPAGSLRPADLARRAQEWGKKLGLKVDVLDEKEIDKERMGLLSAVADAAKPYAPPRVVRIEYRPKKKSKRGKHVALVGKGLTFDSGGLDIKPADGMLDMKVDMSGAAAVLGAMVALAQLEPRVAVTGYMGCVENGIGGNAYHPGDVLTSRKWLTVEINNTDAEGRLVLADVIDWAITKDEPDLLIDLATLTGACMVALGPTTAGVFTEDDELAADIRTVGKRNGEDFWRLPLNDELFTQLKSNIADMKNTGLRYGGAITAAIFLKQFVDGRVKWAHLDIAGPADTSQEWDYIPKGGVGFGVRTLVGLIDPA
jgi:leucyl aminopeptidase